MPKVILSARILIDDDFYNKVIAENPDQNLMRKLMYINAQSKEHRRNHNRMPLQCYQRILGGGDDKKESILKASFRPISEPKNIGEIEDEIEKNVKYSIALASDTPYKTIIFTSEDKIGDYEKNHRRPNQGLTSYSIS